MTATEELDGAERVWATCARARLEAVTVAVGALRSELDALVAGQESRRRHSSDQVISACNTLADWLARSTAPRRLRRADGELGAAAGVYRNAAFVFRSLIDWGQRSEGPVSTLPAMLRQDDGHVQAFLAIVASRDG